MNLRTIALLATLVLSSPAAAHEFWIEPETFDLQPGALLRIGLRHGERFLGDPVPRNAGQIDRFEISGPGGAGRVLGRDGGLTSFARGEEDGWHIIGYRSRPIGNVLAADDFETYLEEEGLGAIVARRAALGESDAPGREVYSRCAKAMIAVGNANTGHDRRLGHPLELVPMQDAQAVSAGDRLTLTLLHLGEPLAGATVVAVAVDDPRSLHRATTDTNGHVSFALDRVGAWMFTTIHMVRAPEEVDADWESFWASLTLETGS